MESTAKEQDEPALGSYLGLGYALGHHLRARIAAELSKRSMGLPELAKMLDEPLALVTYHHGVLKAAGGLPEAGKELAGP